MLSDLYSHDQQIHKLYLEPVGRVVTKLRFEDRVCAVVWSYRNLYIWRKRCCRSVVAPIFKPLIKYYMCFPKWHLDIFGRIIQSSNSKESMARTAVTISVETSRGIQLPSQSSGSQVWLVVQSPSTMWALLFGRRILGCWICLPPF